MSRHQTHTTLALVVLSAVACSDDGESSDTKTQSSDSCVVAADAGADKPAGGRGGGAAAGRGAADSAGEGGVGGTGGARAAGAGEARREGDKGDEAKGGAGGTVGSPTAGAGGVTGSSADDDAGVSAPQGQGPHFKAGNLQGHMWLAQSGAGTTLTATGYDAAVVSGPVCIQGSVAATPDYNSNAALGLNLNQLPNAAPMPFTPTLAGLQVDVMNRAGSPLRIQIQTQDGTGSWCAGVNGSGGFIAWTDFNTACWDGSGMAYALQPLAVASLQVSGGIDAAIPYDFCFIGLTETAAPTATAPAPFRAEANPN